MNSNFRSSTVVIKLILKIRKYMLYLLDSVSCIYENVWYTLIVYIYIYSNCIRILILKKILKKIYI